MENPYSNKFSERNLCLKTVNILKLCSKGFEKEAESVVSSNGNKKPKFLNLNKLCYLIYVTDTEKLALRAF